MPTIITHTLIGVLSASTYSLKEYKKRFWFFSVLLPIIPDFDVIGFYFNISYSHFFGHRGFFHSIPFAFLLSIIIVLFFFRGVRFLSLKSNLLIIYFGLLTSSHGIFDAMTNGGLGVALLSPFNTNRIFLPFTPIEVSPLGLQAFFSRRGLEVILSELYYLWLPFILIFLLTLIFKKRTNKSEKI